MKWFNDKWEEMIEKKTPNLRLFVKKREWEEKSESESLGK